MVRILFTKSGNPQKLLSHLKSQLELELEIIKQIDKRENFETLFLGLIKGEHIIKTMNKGEKQLLKRMKKGIGEIFSGEITEGITYQWVGLVFDNIEARVHELMAQEGTYFEFVHENIDFEFVNRPEFVILVREIIKDIKQKPVSEQMINVFVHLFREWFNDRE